MKLIKQLSIFLKILHFMKMKKAEKIKLIEMTNVLIKAVYYIYKSLLF